MCEVDGVGNNVNAIFRSSISARSLYLFERFTEISDQLSLTCMCFAIGYKSGNAKLTHCRMMKQIFSSHLTTYGPLLYHKYNIYKLNRYMFQIRFSSNRPITHPFQINLSDRLKYNTTPITTTTTNPRKRP